LALVVGAALISDAASVLATVHLTFGVLHVTIGVDTVPEAGGALGERVAAVLRAIGGVASRQSLVK